MNSFVPAMLHAWLLTPEDIDDQMAVAAQMYKGMSRYDEVIRRTVQAETDWFILELIHCSEL